MPDFIQKSFIHPFHHNLRRKEFKFLQIYCFLPKKEAQKLVFAHFDNFRRIFRDRPQFTDQRRQNSHLFIWFLSAYRYLPLTNRDPELLKRPSPPWLLQKNLWLGCFREKIKDKIGFFRSWTQGFVKIMWKCFF